jgi:hypothetical protein
MAKKVNIDLDYESLEKMILSSDVENRVMAINVLDSVDFNKNIAMILLIYKATKDKDLWKEIAPNLYNKINKVRKVDEKNLNHSLTFREILDVLKQKNCGEKDINIFLKAVSLVLLKDLSEYGFDFIETLDITIKKKYYEQTR